MLKSKKFFLYLFLIFIMMLFVIRWSVIDNNKHKSDYPKTDDLHNEKDRKIGM